MTINILITGATGYLGSQIVTNLCLKTDIQPICLKRSFSKVDRLNRIIGKIVFYNIDEIDLKNIFKEQKIDVILHCATNYGRKNNHRSEIVEANLLMPLQLLECAVRHGTRVFINTDTMLDKRISAYTLSKKHFRDWLQLLSNQILCISVALEHFYGPGDDDSKFVTTIINDLLNEVDSIPLTKGEQKRDFIFIDDVVSAFEHIIRYVINPQSPRYGFEEFQVGSGQSIAVRDFVMMAKEITGNKATELVFGARPYRLNEVMELSVDLRRITALGWNHQIDLLQSLQKTIQIGRQTLCQNI